MGYGVIYADPPWPYSQYRKAANGAAASAYKCMSIADIRRIPIWEFANPNCVLFLWTTGPMIAHGSMTAVLQDWGFEGKTCIPWLKNSPTSADLATGIGIWFMANAEYLICATRGKIGGFFEKLANEDKPRRLRGGNLGVVIGDRGDPEFWQRESERALLAPKDTKHSRKPPTIRDYAASFEGPHLELFAREQHSGWTCWGLEDRKST